jgi:hypothetical protein
MQQLGADTQYQMIVLATQKGLIDPKALPLDTY